MSQNVTILSTYNGDQLARDITVGNDSYTYINLSHKKFANQEVYVKVLDNIRRKHVYIIATGSGYKEWNLNDCLMELILLMDACKRADVMSITLICPCFPYIRQDKKLQSREPISAKAISGCIEKYINRIAVVDSHFAQFQGFFDCPVDNLYSIHVFCHYLAEQYLGEYGQYKDDYVLVSPDGGGAKRIEHYAELLQMKHVVMDKKRDYTKSNTISNSELHYESDIKLLKGKTAILIDDIIDSAGTITASCRELDKYDTDGYILLATHGIFSSPARERIDSNEKIRSVIVTDSVPHDECSDKVKIVSIAPMLQQYINELEQEGGSVSGLFEDTPIFKSRSQQQQHH